MQPAELTAVVNVVYRRFPEWLKKSQLMKILGDEDCHEDEDPPAACLRGSLGIGRVVNLDEAADVEGSEEQGDEECVALGKSPRTGEFGGSTVHAYFTVHAADGEGRKRLVRCGERPALTVE